MALFSKRVDIDEAAVAVLVGLYHATYTDLRRIVITVAGQKITFTSVQQAQALIRHRLTQLNQQLDGWINSAVPASYETGRHDAIGELQSFDHPMTDAVAAGIIAGSVRTQQLHDESVQSMTGEMQRYLGEATTQMSRSASGVLDRTLRTSVRARMANQDQPSPSKTKATQDIKQAIEDVGIYALMDRAGKRWMPDTYAGMLATTALTQARNTGLTNSLLSVDYDLVEVSTHGASDACGKWEGQILSIAGATPGYPSIGDAIAGGLFHPNCQHGLSPVSPTDYPLKYWPSDTNPDGYNGNPVI